MAGIPALTLELLTLTLMYCLVEGQRDIPNDLSATFEIVEESPPSSYIGNVAEGAGLANIFNETTLQKLEYGFLAQSKSSTDYFQLDSSNGDLRTRSEIDREDICPGEEECYININVAIVKPSELFQVISVQVTVKDLNDKAPVFTPTQYHVRFSESDPIGTSRALPIALDMDSPQYGVKEYRLGMTVGEFKLLQVNNPINGLIDLKLQLRNSLDREIRDSYRIRVEALDHGTPPLVGNLVIEVSVDDDNDHSPRFSNELYEVDVPEDFSLYATFFTTEAQDNDQGDNGKVIYGFSPRTTTMHGDIFAINQATGEVSLKAGLDYENEDVYHLEVTATDMGSNPRSTLSTLKVQVLDINDNQPSITISTLTEKPEAEISENQPRGKFVAHLSVFDADSGQNGVVTCSLMHPLFELESMRTNQYKIVTAVPLDREGTGRFLLDIECSDLGNPSLSSSQNITVIVLDQNDNRPRFSQSSYSGTVPENLVADAYILHVTATDEDTGSNAMITFEILQRNVSAYVVIDPESGTIQARKVLDYEEVHELRFTVRATDGGSPPMSADVPVSVRILDSNDASPQFLKNHYIFYIAENLPARTYVGRVTANDADSPPFNIFEYSLSKQNALDKDLFYVDGSTGNVYTTEILDHEDKSLYYLNLHATDIDNPSFMGSATLTIIVQDENDNAPIIHFPLNKNATFPISNKVPVGYNITKVFATDPDAGQNGNITFVLLSGDGEHFRIDPANGFLQTNTELDGLSYEEFKLGIRVQDDGEPAQYTDVTAKIVVDQGVPFYAKELPTAMVQRTNLTIIIVVAAVSGFVIVILVIAIVVLKTTDCRRANFLRKGDGAPRVFTDLNIKAIEANGYMQQQNVANTNLQAAKIPSVSGEVHQDTLHPDVIHKLERETDNHSMSSADISNTDSGRGPSEEGGEGGMHRNNQNRFSSKANSARPQSHHSHGNHGKHHHGYQAPVHHPTTELNSHSDGYASKIPSVHKSQPHFHGNQLHSADGNKAAMQKQQPDPTNGAHGYQSSSHGNSCYHHSANNLAPKSEDSVRHSAYGNSCYIHGNQNNSQAYSHQGNQHTNAWPHQTHAADSHHDSTQNVRAGPKRVIHAVNV